MYTFQAIADINTINDHSSFYAIAVICTILAAIALMGSDDVEELRVYMLFFAVVTALAAGVSYNTGSVTTYANKKVEATLVGFQAEGWNAQSGKTRADHHETYVVYATPTGNVMLHAKTGIDYPKQAILYKN